MSKLSIIKHPLIQDSLTHLRNQETSLQEFRYHSNKICELLFFEALQDLNAKQVKIITPLTATKGEKLADEVIVVPVLRAGLAMLFGALQLLPKSKIGFIGLERDEVTAVARQYYWKLPKITKNSVVIVTDPMLATGGSLGHLLRQIAPQHPKSMSIVSVVAAPEGIKAIKKEFPDVKIFTAALDDHLNDRCFIVPGLGDYGDRYFGTI